MNFNQGVLQLKKEDVPAGIFSFEQSAREAESRGDSGLAAQAWYNRGVAQAQSGQLKESIQSYRNAIVQAQKAGLPDLEKDARKNLELLKQMKQEQQQKKDQEKKDDPKNQEQKQKQEKEKQQKQQDKKDDPKDQDQNDEKKDKKEKPQPVESRSYKSPTLSEEDAKRIMTELTGREKETHMKLKKQRGRRSGEEEDW